MCEVGRSTFLLFSCSLSLLSSQNQNSTQDCISALPETAPLVAILICTFAPLMFLFLLTYFFQLLITLTLDAFFFPNPWSQIFPFSMVVDGLLPRSRPLCTSLALLLHPNACWCLENSCPIFISIIDSYCLEAHFSYLEHVMTELDKKQECEYEEIKVMS